MYWKNCQVVTVGLSSTIKSKWLEIPEVDWLRLKCPRAKH